jgi:hypothetical protein
MTVSPPRDIVVVLREYVEQEYAPLALLENAANEIERLRREVVRLSEAKR